MLSFSLGWEDNNKVMFQMTLREELLKEIFAMLSSEDIREILQFSSCDVSGDEKGVWDFLQKELVGFSFPKPTRISVRRF